MQAYCNAISALAETDQDAKFDYFNGMYVFTYIFADPKQVLDSMFTADEVGDPIDPVKPFAVYKRFS